VQSSKRGTERGRIFALVDLLGRMTPVKFERMQLNAW
jgi:hypothetical protein